MSDALERARGALNQAQRVVVLTGAGISAESGVPTFRGPGGLWKSFRPEQLATPEAFARDPQLVWEWYAWRRSLLAACTPNPGHRALAEYAARHPDRVTLVTQNVDGLHGQAARDALAARTLPAQGSLPDSQPTPARPVPPLEVHGAIHRDRCSRCGARTDAHPSVDTTSVASLPRCTSCDGLLRPDVVWFGEALDETVLGAAFEAARVSDACIVAGTSALVYPAASVPQITRSAGGTVIEVNVASTALSAWVDVVVTGSTAQVLPALLA